MADPNDKVHAALILKVKKFCEGLNIQTINSILWYDRCANPAMKLAMSRIEKPELLAIRCAPDEFSFHADLGVGFFWDAKTIQGEHKNIALEIYPYLHAMDMAKSGARTPFAFHVDSTCKDLGFWAATEEQHAAGLVKWMPTKLFFPRGYSAEVTEYLLRRCRAIWPERTVPYVIDAPATNGGSNNPFMVISGEVAKIVFESWQAEITNALLQATAARDAAKRETPPPMPAPVPRPAPAPPRPAAPAGWLFNPDPYAR